MPSKLDQLQQQFRQRIDQQKEEKLSSIRIYNVNQQKVLERVSNSNGHGMGSQSGSYPNSMGVNANSSMSPTSVSLIETKKPGSLGLSHQPPARKNGSGVDRSRPLKPMLIKPAVKAELSSGSLEQSGLPACTLRKPTTGSTMVLGTRPRPATASSVPNNSAAVRNGAHNRMTVSPVSTKVEVKKTGAGNKTVTTTVKPNEIMKVTVETTKKATPPSSTGHSVTTTVKTTIHKRTITPVKSAPILKNGHCSPGVSSTVKSTTPIARRNPSVISTRGSSAPAGTNGPRNAPPDPNMAECTICRRRFAKDRIEKHLEICQKTSVRKRKPFDATKMRTQGTEAEQYVRRGTHKKEEPKLAKKGNWRSKHEEFIESIRQAKVVQKHLEAGGKLSDLPPPKPSENPDYVPCPHCGRKFNEGAAERHIPKCKNIVSNKKATAVKKK